ncbi:Uncharacterized protein SCF082_LOCUS3917, partial [Durusdinium trenchii]
DLLPTWGGKAEDILHQPKSWSSERITKEIRLAQRRQLGIRRKRPGHAAKDRLLPPQNQLQLLPEKRGQRQPRTLKALQQQELLQDQRLQPQLNEDEEQHQKLPMQQADDDLLLHQDLQGNNGGMLDTETMNELSMGNQEMKAVGRWSRANPARRVQKRCDLLRSDPALRNEFLASVVRARGERIRAAQQGRNLVVENKWLCDDRKACAAYWEEVRSMREQVKEAPTIQDKIQLYSMWPHPPAPNHSRAQVEDKVKKRAAALAARVARAKALKREQDSLRQEVLLQKVNKKEQQFEEARAQEAASRVYGILAPVLVHAKAAALLAQHLLTARDKAEEIKKMKRSAQMIQRRWKSSKSGETGLKFRNAIKVMRRFAKMAVKARNEDRKQRSAETIRWFLAQYENSNFQKVMRNYRIRVIKCQRYFRSYVAVTKARLKVLGMKWDRVEREWIRTDKHKALQEVKRVEEGERRDTKRGTIAMAIGEPGLGGLSPSRPRQQRSGRRQSNTSNFRRQLSRKPSVGVGIGMNLGLGTGKGLSGALAMAAELGIHVHRKVPKAIKRDIIKAHLSHQRVLYKQRWREHCRSRNIMKAQSRLMTVEDVRSVVQAQSDAELLLVLDKKLESQEENHDAPFLKLFGDTTTAVIRELVDKGRAIADEQILQVLNEEDEKEDAEVFEESQPNDQK